MNLVEFLGEMVERRASDVFFVAGLPLTYQSGGRQTRLGEGALMPAEIDEAAAVIIASDEHIDTSRFSGKPLVGVLRADGAPPWEWEELHGLLARDPDTLILHTTGIYDINAAGALRHWTNEWARP